MRAAKRIALALVVCASAPRAMGSESPAKFVPANVLQSDIRKAPEQSQGIALVSYLREPGYSASVVRRTRPGNAEIHKNVADVWYVVAGEATLVTGGSLSGGRETEPGELRGGGISGGAARHIGTGDFISIPAGVPHWVSAVAGKELIYLVVKVKTITHAR
ncbi:MAG TPA: hypothetical protein VGI20_14510 [Rhizomicrobium sp.]|jgi:mannose-6-phosphate isomerase-like protein (cupin superfamily)